MVLVLDTGPIVALADRDDPAHARCVALVEQLAEDLVVPAFVLVEVDYWLRKLAGAGAWRTFADDVVSGIYRVHRGDEAELGRAAELETTYENLGLGLVDASVIACCERLGETKVATLDRRHFSVVRPGHCESLRLLPD